MPNRYFLPAATALLLAAATAQAQQPWQPFRPRLTYQLHEAATPGDTTHTLRLGSAAAVPGTTTDSLFIFNGRVGRMSEPSTVANCYGKQRLRPDNLFGATLRSQPHAVYVLAAANGRTLTLRPLAALGQSWTTGRPGLTASVSARATASVLGTAPDSVVTITFSDGQVLRLSKSYGLLEGPSLDSYLNGRNRRRQLTLSALPERQLGTALTGARAIYDYQPGDIFQRITKNYVLFAGQPSLCQQFWTQDSVLTRTLSRTGDTLTYTLLTRQRSQGFGNASYPSYACTTPSTTILYAPVTRTQRVLVSQHPSAYPPLLTGTFKPSGTMGSGAIFGYQTSAAARNSTRFNNQLEYSMLVRTSCSTASTDSLVLVGDIDNYNISRYAVGLGYTYRYDSGISAESTEELTAFRKGTQSWGTFFSPRLLLAARPERAATTTAFPNPFGDGPLTVAFTLARPQPVAATLHDALGRAVRTLPPAALPTGAQQLTLPATGLPAGLYTLHLRFTLDERTEVLKVLKSN